VTFPSSQPPVPAVVGGLAGGRSVDAVSVNEEGGVTFRVASDIPGTAGREFIRVANARTADFAGEARRLRWASRYLPVPQVLGLGVEKDCALPVRSCPFDWSAPSRLARLSPGSGRYPQADARARLAKPPPVDRLVVCHDDACSPNTLIDDDGRCCGHLDFGDLGVAAADLAVASCHSGGTTPAGCGTRSSSPPTGSSQT